MLTMGQAAKLTGLSKPTIARAIKGGRLSASRAVDGSYAIEPSELERVYRITGNAADLMKRSTTPSDTSAARGNGGQHRDELVVEQAETIRDLRTRLDACETERRQLQAQLVALISDQRQAPARRRAWKFWRTD